MATWCALIVEVDASVAETFSEALLAAGATAAHIEDACAGTPEERPVFDEPTLDGAAGWRRARVTALVAANTDPDALLAVAGAEAGIAAPQPYVVAPVDEQDWVRHSQSQFAPLRISERLWIVPSWRDPPDPRAVNIVLDPGRAFGTGHHPTTRACLRWLERHMFPGADVLDYGCGSGILAIAAMRLGAARAVGIDADGEALVAARENAGRNGVVVTWYGADAPLDLRVDLVLANILAGPLKLLAPLLARHCRPAGRIVLAGILEAQAADVAEAFAPWFDVTTADRVEGWVSLDGVRR